MKQQNDDKILVKLTSNHFIRQNSKYNENLQLEFEVRAMNRGNLLSAQH